MELKLKNLLNEDDRFDNSVYHKPSDLKKIGWIVINARKNDGRPLYKLYIGDPKDWGATYRVGSGKFPEDHKLFTTIPIKVEGPRKFRFFQGEDEGYSRPYAYDKIEIKGKDY